MVIVLLVYCLIDTHNRIYGNLIAGGIGSLLAFVVAMLSLNGGVSVYTSPVLATSYLVNNTSTIYEYTDYSIPMISGALGWFYVLVGVILSVLVIIQLAEAYIEKRRDEDEF